MFLENFTRHPSRSIADHISKSILCGRCGAVNYHPLLNLQDFIYKAFGGWKCDRGTTKLHVRILRGQGVQKKKTNMFTVGSSTSATFVLPVYTQLYTHICMYIYIYGYKTNTLNTYAARAYGNFLAWGHNHSSGRGCKD